LNRRHHIIRNIIDVKRKINSASVLQQQQQSPKRRVMSVQDYEGGSQSVMTMGAKRNPQDPIINSRRPFNVSNYFNVFDHLD